MNEGSHTHRKTASIGTARQEGTHTSSMKSIESSMVALSVSLSSYLTNNRGGPEDEEPVVKAVVISTKNSKKRTEDASQQEKKPRKRREHHQPRVALDLTGVQHASPKKPRVHS